MDAEMSLLMANQTLVSPLRLNGYLSLRLCRLHLERLCMILSLEQEACFTSESFILSLNCLTDG